MNANVNINLYCAQLHSNSNLLNALNNTEIKTPSRCVEISWWWRQDLIDRQTASSKLYVRAAMVKVQWSVGRTCPAETIAQWWRTPGQPCRICSQKAADPVTTSNLQLSEVAKSCHNISIRWYNIISSEFTRQCRLQNNLS